MSLRVSLALAGIALLGAMTMIRDETEPPPTSAVPVDPSLGFSPGAPFLALDDDRLAADLDAVRAAGGTWIRIDVDWSHVEADPGELDWAAVDRVVEAATERELSVLGLLTYTPTWARPPGTSDKYPPNDADDFAAFAAAATARYATTVAAWEIWNEPNTAQFWEPGPDPVRYGELLIAAVEAIRAVDPDAVVLSGGLAPAVDERAVELSALTFLDELLDVTGDLDVDAIAVHPYSFPALPSDDVHWSLFAQLPDIRALLVERLGAAPPMWITEYGAPTGTGDRAVAEARQADLILDALACAARVDWIGPTFVYSIRDIADGDPDDLEDNFGVLFADGASKPVHDMLRGAVDPAPVYGCDAWSEAS